MCRHTIIPALISAVISMPLLSQSDFESSLARYRGNKILLLGEWGAEDNNIWKQLIDSDGIYEHGFTLLNRASITNRGNDAPKIIGVVRNIEAFEVWFRQKYGLSGSTRWAALDMENQLIVNGTQLPSSKELEQMLEQCGIKSPMRKVRDFLRQNPDHLDARADLLKEVRRRALHQMPPNITEDLNTETDLRTWAVLANETDMAFSGAWLGLEINFFSPDQEQPERHSKLMRNVFAKHISKIESAIRLEPANRVLWNIWAWMARGLPDYKWTKFTDTIELFNFDVGDTYPKACPTADVCVWLVEDARSKKDWDSVLKFAKAAREFDKQYSVSKTEWSPGRRSFPVFLAPIKDYPGKSAYAPHLEALLKLGDIEEANKVYDEMIRYVRYGSNNALFAAEVARSVGMEELAKTWEKGEHIEKVLYFAGKASRFPFFLKFTEHESDFDKKIDTMAKKLTPSMFAQECFRDEPTLGWKKDGGDRWGLIGGNRILLAQGTTIPEPEFIQGILDDLDLVNDIELMRRYAAKHSDQPGFDLIFAFELINTFLYRDTSTEEAKTLWQEITAHLGSVLRNYPDLLINLPPAHFYIYGNIVMSEREPSISEPVMKSLARPYLTYIEMLMERKPSSELLWSQWFFWRSVEGNERPIDAMVPRLKYSPLSGIDTGLPTFALNQYYQECQKNNDWLKLVELLRTVWDRELFRYLEAKELTQDQQGSLNQYYDYDLGELVGIPLIEAYLNADMIQGANEIFNTWLDFGNKFNDISKIVELAIAKGHERLAKEWERKIGTSSSLSGF